MTGGGLQISRGGHRSIEERWESGRQRVNAWMLLLALMGLLTISPVPDARATHRGSVVTWYPATWNGYWIYLSPAHHYAGDNAGCSGYSEEGNARSAMLALGSDLRNRGYRVRMGNGDPTQNPTAANAMNPLPRYYLAMHSNGTTQNGALCQGTRGGTEVYNQYGNQGGSFLAEEIKNNLGSVSPGTGD